MPGSWEEYLSDGSTLLATINDKISANNQALQNHASELGALNTKLTQNSGLIAANSAGLADKVSVSRKINGHSLASDISLGKNDVGLGNVANKSEEELKTSILTTDNVKSVVTTNDLLDVRNELPAAGKPGEEIIVGGIKYIWVER